MTNSPLLLPESTPNLAAPAIGIRRSIPSWGPRVRHWIGPGHSVVGYRALAVGYSELGRFGKNGLDVVEHGPGPGVRFHW